MDLIAKGIAGLLVLAAFLLVSHAGVLDTRWAAETLQQAVRVSARMTGEGR